MNISLSWLKKVNGFTAQWVITVFVVGLMIGVLIGGAGVLSPPHRAAWVQAIGTIIAVALAGLVAVWQVRRNHELAVERQDRLREQAYFDTAKALEKTIEDCLRYVRKDFEEIDSLEKLKGLETDKYDPMFVAAYQDTLKNIRLDKLPVDLIEPVSFVRFIVEMHIPGMEFIYKGHKAATPEAFELLQQQRRRTIGFFEDCLEQIEKAIKNSHPEK